MSAYRCSLYMQADGALPHGDFRPFRTAEEMTRFTGLSVESWNARVLPKAERKRAAAKRGPLTRSGIEYE